MTAMMSIYLFRLVFRKLGMKGVMAMLALPVAVIAVLFSFIF